MKRSKNMEKIPVEMHLVNYGLCAHNLQEVLDKTEPFLPTFRHFVQQDGMNIKTRFNCWTVRFQPEGNAGWCSVAVDDKTTVAEFLVVANGRCRDRWEECLRRCRNLHNQGLAPLSGLDEKPPDCDTWIAVIFHNGHFKLSAESENELELLVVGLSRALVEKTLQTDGSNGNN
jgi:hypothetical protein